MPVLFMRLVWAWPDASRGAAKAFVSCWGNTLGISVLTASGVAHLLSGEHDGVISALSTVGDVAVGLVTIVKIHRLHRHGAQVRTGQGTSPTEGYVTFRIFAYSYYNQK